jgi:hypothetical protein
MATADKGFLARLREIMIPAEEIRPTSGNLEPVTKPAIIEELFQPDEAFRQVALGQGVELSPVVSLTPVQMHADLWMLGSPSYRRRIAFTESIGTRFGDIGLTTSFVLDRWGEGPAGLTWVLDPIAYDMVGLTTRGEDILARCLVKTRTGLLKRAASQCWGDLEHAIILAIDEQMQVFGLDQFLPEAAEVA